MIVTEENYTRKKKEIEVNCEHESKKIRQQLSRTNT